MSYKTNFLQSDLLTSDKIGERRLKVESSNTSGFSGDVLGKTALSSDAWGRQKVINDYSIFHALFTYDVPDRVWEELSVDASMTYTPLVQTGTLVSSVGGALRVASGTTANAGSTLSSKRHPRYQPNRGHLYSTAGWMPNPESDGNRKWGIMCGCLSDTRRSGAYFELEGNGSTWALYAVVRSYGTILERTDITSLLPAGFDISKGHLYDIQFQWRGVGDYCFFIDQQLIYTVERLGAYSALGLWNPALSVAFECTTNTTTELDMFFGCVDVTSEGGAKDSRQFASISTGTGLINAASTGSAVLAVRVPRTLTYNSDTVINTRDLVASKLTSWTRDEAAVQVYFARDTVATTLNGLTWTSLPDSTANYLVGGAGSALDTAFQTDRASMQLVLNEWDDLEQKNIVINPDQDAAPFYITGGDIMVIAVQSVAGTDENSTTLYLSEEL